MRLRSGNLILIAVLSASVVCCAFMVRDAREAARRSTCLGNLCQLKLAIYNYHETYDTLPPAYIADENGRPMHSWRILLLPFIEAHDLYEEYRFDEPWNGPNNRKLASRMPQIYRCPSYVPGEGERFHTNYVVVVGQQTAFPGSHGVRFADITDDRSRTVMITETCNAHIHWMAPRDLNFETMAGEINSPTGEGISSMHDDLANNIRINGDYHSPLMADRPAAMTRAVCTINGGEVVGED